MLLLAFFCLQALDALTTLLFLREGVAEANPLVHAVLELTQNPALALVAVKLLAIALALYAWRTGRGQLLRRINVLFALFVGWNMLAIAAGSGVI
ncbi:MAG TPA: DUF5658 family protein [Bryobacteraceae bacterium]|nr:DUF5658 family protein [Bryobacteraceae bacterium]